MGGDVSFCWLAVFLSVWLAVSWLAATATGRPSHDTGRGGAPVTKFIQQRTLLTGGHRPPGGDFSTGPETPQTLTRSRVEPTNRNTG